ncbi:MAG: DUF1559 domain-containing protein [Planctomycetota bacterium]
MKREASHSLTSTLALTFCGVLVSCLLIPRVARHRASARASGCSNNLRMLGLALHNYHSAYKQLPILCGGTAGGEDSQSNQGRLGLLVPLLPFAENQQLWETIVNPHTNPSTDQSFPSMGPAPWFDPEAYGPWKQCPAVFQCPDDPAESAVELPKVVFTLEPVSSGGDGAVVTNYVACLGDTTDAEPMRQDSPAETIRVGANHRGFFKAAKRTRFRDILDGLAHTMMFSETIASVKPTSATKIYKEVNGLQDNPTLCLAAAQSNGPAWDFGRGARWCDGALPFTGYQAILPPNAPSCTSELGMMHGTVSASSRHEGGVYVLMGDGAVVFITENIDTGDPSRPTVRAGGTDQSAPGRRSPYGLWGALGTRANAEVIGRELALATARHAEMSLYERMMREPFNRSRPTQISPPSTPGVTWTDTTGRIKLTATFVRIIDQRIVELKDSQGVLHQVPLNSLKDEDIFRAVEKDLTSSIK